MYERLLERISERNVSRSLVFPVEAFKIFSQDKVHPLLLTIQLVLMMLWMRLVMGFFELRHGKKVWSAGQVSADLPRRVSSWTPAAYGQTRGSDEEVEVLLCPDPAPDADAVGPASRAHWAPLPSRGGGRGRRGGRGGRLVPPLALFEAALIVVNGSGTFLVFPGDVSPRAVFPSYGGRPRCLASWWPRSSLTPPAAYARLVLLVFHLAMCSILSFSGPRCSASWPVWTRTIMCLAGLPVTVPLVLCSLLVFTPMMLGMTQVDSYIEEYKNSAFLGDDAIVSVFGSLLRQWIHLSVYRGLVRA